MELSSSTSSPITTTMISTASTTTSATTVKQKEFALNGITINAKNIPGPMNSIFVGYGERMLERDRAKEREGEREILNVYRIDDMTCGIPYIRQYFKLV